MKRILPFITGIFLVGQIHAQHSPNPALTADSLSTGNYKDVLKSFFQLAFDRLISQDKEISFTSNPFAVMAKLDTSLLKDTKYYKYRHLRDLNFSFGLKLDSSFRFNGFSSAIKYALINKRDETVSRAFLISVAEDYKTREFFALNADLDAYISSFSDRPDQQSKLRSQKTQFTRGEINFNQLDPLLRQEVKRFVEDEHTVHLSSLIKEDPEFNIHKAAQTIYDSLKRYWNSKLLWTVGVSDTTYKDQFFFSNILLETQILKGFGKMKPGSNWEFDVRAAVNFLDDNLSPGRDLKRSLFSFEPGFNWVIRTKGNQQSFFEFKLSGSYLHNFRTLYPNERSDSLTLNGTVRLRIIGDIWVPLEIRYDPRSGNVFGFLNVRANFTALGKLAKEL